MSWRPVVGAARAEVAVPVGTPLAGFAARTAPSSGTHDPITVGALVVDQVCLVSIDCCVLHEDTCAAIREQALALTGLEEVVVAATHTHAGPSVGLNRVGADAAAVRESMVITAVEVITEAWGSGVPARARHGQVRGLGIARNRRHLDHDIDPPLHVVAFDDDSGARVASLVSYPCHPVVLDGANTLVSADYIGPLREGLEQAVGGLCLFFTGAAGDVNTGHSAESSFAARGTGQRTFTEARRIGRMLAAAAAGADLDDVGDPVGRPVRSAPVTLDLSPLDHDLVDQQRARWREALTTSPQDGLLQAWSAWAETLPSRPITSWTGRVTVLAWGGLDVVALPGEPFLAAAEYLAGLGAGPVVTLGYCDGVPGYLPSCDEYPLGGYEVDDAHRYYAMPAGFARGSLEQLLEVARRLIED